MPGHGEIEVFVHGALCIAYSGRCLLSGYFNHHDPNQGTCTNARRWEYKTHDAQVDPNTGEALASTMDKGVSLQRRSHARDADAQFTGTGYPAPPLADQVYLLEEANRPGELMPIMEGRARHLHHEQPRPARRRACAAPGEIGVDSLKIEGRTKSLYYVARTAQVYRRAIDDAVAGRPFNRMITELEGLANRGYTGVS